MLSIKYFSIQFYIHFFIFVQVEMESSYSFNVSKILVLTVKRLFIILLFFSLFHGNLLVWLFIILYIQ